MVLDNLDEEFTKAVEYYWEKRSDQEDAHAQSQQTARGRRAEVLGGEQMDGFTSIVKDALIDIDVPPEDVLKDSEVPGYYRATKEWDVVVVHGNELLAAIEFKSMASSFGNNLNNRVEEALGNNADLKKAYEEGVFDQSEPPWIGYVLLMADTPKSNKDVRVDEPNFDVAPEFNNASYIDRAELFCERMLDEDIIDDAALITAKEGESVRGEYSYPNPDYAFDAFLSNLRDHVDPKISFGQPDLDSAFNRSK